MTISPFVFSPSLDQIRQHPFFNDGVQIPLFLPSSATETTPQWTHDEFGQLVPQMIGSENASSLLVNDSKKDKLLSIARGGSTRRLPLKAKDPNVNYGSEYEKPVEKDWGFSSNGFVQSGAVAASAKRSAAAISHFPRKSKPEVQPAFRVFDETADTAGSGSLKGSNHSKPPQARQSQTRLDSLMSMAANMRLDEQERTPAEKPLPPPTDNDAEVLLLMLERLSNCLDVSEQHKFSYDSSRVKPLSRGAPTKWITRYVDYTSKYGLGFLMNDGRYDRVCRLNDCANGAIMS
jgi:hypothetical protein